MTRFPRAVEDLTPDLLTSALSDFHPGAVVESFAVAETSVCGDGRASTADRVKLELRYAEGGDAELPSTLLLKTMLWQPHAPQAMYHNEVRFYREVRPELSIEAPRVYGSLFDEETGQFGILMEDLRLRGARFPNATTPISLEEITGLVTTLADLHAAWWDSERFGGDMAWVATPRSGGMFPIFDSFGLELIGDQVAKNPFKAELIAPLKRSLTEMWVDLWKHQARLDSGPTTLLHGDPHIANTYLLPGGRGGLLDWQLMVRGRWAHDFTYLLVTGLDTELRRKHEGDLLAFYLDALRARGVAAPPPGEEARLLYRQSVVWGLVIGWLITPPQNYGEEITAANLKRLVAAAEDLETFEALRN